jgi:HEPN superfamily RiboL-PSP-like protein
MNQEVRKNKQRLDDLFNRVETFFGDQELQAHLAKYLCIAVSGFLENSLRAIYREYSARKSQRNVANYVDVQLDGFMNPSMEKILTLAGSFSSKWRQELEIEIKEDNIKESVDGLVAIRNQLAHGESVGITFRSVKRQYSDVFRLIEMIQNQCNC